MTGIKDASLVWSSRIPSKERTAVWNVAFFSSIAGSMLVPNESVLALKLADTALPELL